jgi:hypothetical protein
MRSFGNPGCCGWDTRAPFHFGNTPLGEGETGQPAACGRDNINNDRGLFCRDGFVHRKSAMQRFGYTHILLKGLAKVRTVSAVRSMSESSLRYWPVADKIIHTEFEKPDGLNKDWNYVICKPNDSSRKTKCKRTI